MKPSLNVKIGSILQINPITYPEFGGDFLVVTEMKEDLVQGYLAIVFPPVNELTRFKGFAYLRIKWEHVELVGSVEWFPMNKVEDETQEEK